MSEGSPENKAKIGKKPKQAILQQVPQEVIPVPEPPGALPDSSGLTVDPRQLKSVAADSRLTPVQRQAAATQIGRLKGNAYLSSFVQQQLNTHSTGSPEQVQREDDPPGRGQSTDYGTFWIVPDSTNQSYTGVEGEQITESAFAILEDVWAKLKSGTGNLVISETDQNGKTYAGFKNNILSQMVKLLSQPTGRSVVVSLMAGDKLKVTVRPTPQKLYGGGNAIRSDGADALEKDSGEAGKGSGTIIQIDPTLTDDDVKVYDKDKNKISDPVFIILGHEMIHAQHNREGRNQRSQAAASGDYSNKEEEQTVATGPTTENSLRSEHGLKARHGSGGEDTRPGF